MSERENLISLLVAVAEAAEAAQNSVNESETRKATKDLRRSLNLLWRAAGPGACRDCDRPYCVNPNHAGRPWLADQRALASVR